MSVQTLYTMMGDDPQYFCLTEDKNEEKVFVQTARTSIIDHLLGEHAYT